MEPPDLCYQQSPPHSVTSHFDFQWKFKVFKCYEEKATDKFEKQMNWEKSYSGHKTLKVSVIWQTHFWTSLNTMYIHIKLLMLL